MSSLCSSDPIHCRILSYRCYRLSDLNQGVGAAGMIKLWTYVKSLDIKVKENHFDATDPIKVFQFLIDFVTTAYKMSMSKGHVKLALLIYLIGRAKTQFTLIQNSIHAGGISCWPEAIQFFFQSYPTWNVICDALTALHNVRQLPSEEELGYAGRLSTIFWRCGNVHDEATTMKILVKGVSSTGSYNLIPF